MNLPLDVRDDRVALQACAELSTLKGTMHIELLLLDTGSAFELIAPLHAVEGLLDNTWQHRPGALEGFGGRVDAQVGQVSLRIGDANFQRIEVHAVAGEKFWYVGLPILKRCDLMLREAHPRGPHLVLPDTRRAGWP